MLQIYEVVFVLETLLETFTVDVMVDRQASQFALALSG